MTVHVVFRPLLPGRSGCGPVLSLLDHLCHRGIVLRIYAGVSEDRLPPPVDPLSELAFVDNPADILLWNYEGESAEIHLAERFPGKRVLYIADTDDALSDTARTQLQSLTRSFDLVIIESGAMRDALLEMGYHSQAILQVEQRSHAAAAWWSQVEAVRPTPRFRETASVSVVICTWNRADHLESCLEQLRRRRYPKMEVIVVNGPSTDHTERVLERFRPEIKLCRNPAPNLCISRNLGIQAAAGDVIAFLDDDAMAHPDWLWEALAAFDDPLTAAVGGQTLRLFDEMVEFSNGLLTDTAYPWPVQPHPGNHHTGAGELWNTVTGNNCLFRRSALISVGGFDERIAYSHDEADVVLRFARRGFRTRHRPLALVHHASQPSANRRSEFDLNWRVILKNSIYCGYANRPATASKLSFLARTVWDHAKHRLHDPVDWWLYRRVSLSLFLRIEWRCLLGIAEGVAKALTLQPKRFTPVSSYPQPEPFLLWVTAEPLAKAERARKDRHVLFLHEDCNGAQTQLWASARTDDFVPHVVRFGNPPSIDARNGVYHHVVPPDSRTAISGVALPPERGHSLARSVALLHKMQELAVRACARFLVCPNLGNDVRLLASDPRFQTAPRAAALGECEAEYESRNPLLHSWESSALATAGSLPRWKDPLFDKTYAVLPQNGTLKLSVPTAPAPEGARFRVDLFVGLEEACRDNDPVCNLWITTPASEIACERRFTAAAFGATKWAMLSAEFSHRSGPATIGIENTGFTAMRIQRIDLRRKETGIAVDSSGGG